MPSVGPNNICSGGPKVTKPAYQESMHWSPTKFARQERGIDDILGLNIAEEEIDLEEGECSKEKGGRIKRTNNLNTTEPTHNLEDTCMETSCSAQADEHGGVKIPQTRGCVEKPKDAAHDLLVQEQQVLQAACKGRCDEREGIKEPS